jgi:hypothetical protein
MRRRNKPYALKSKEEGRGPAHTRRFSTLAQAAKAVKEQWQGADYMDGEAHFHTDYCTFECVGFKLTDIGTRRFDTEWQCWEFTFHEHLLGDQDGSDQSASGNSVGAPWE